ncbi:hypothetical protein ACFX1S_034916 [Malus domestica]
MRLNPNKCAFDVGSGKFLGFMISQQSIEANLEKIKAILDMKEPVASKDIQSLTGKVAALTRFISKATDKCAHFFKALKGSKKYITWTDECAEAFKNLKDYMSKAPILSKPEVGDTLIIYLSVSASAAVLFSFEMMVMSNGLYTTLARPYKIRRHYTLTLRNWL